MHVGAVAMSLLLGLSLPGRAELLSFLDSERVLRDGRRAGHWALVSENDGESRGQILACQVAGRWYVVTAGGGCMGFAELSRYGVPEKFWKVLLRRSPLAEEQKLIQEDRLKEAAARDTEELAKPGDFQFTRAWWLLIWRNRIYARHGYVFHEPALAEYFKARRWYRPKPEFNPSSLNAVERRNLQLISKAEKERGWNF